MTHRTTVLEAARRARRPTMTAHDDRAEIDRQTMPDTAAEIASIESVPLPDGVDLTNRIVVEHLNIYYGDFLAVEDVNMVIEPRSVTALIGPSGCGKSTFLRSLNRMHEVIDGARVEGTVLLDGVDLYGPRRRPGRRAPQGRHGVPAAQPVPDDVDLRQRAGRQAAEQQALEEGRGRRPRREVAARRQPLGRGQGPPRPARAPACPAVSSSACASPGPSPSSPRCC